MDLGSGYSLEFTSWSPDRELNPQYEDIPDIDQVGAIVTCPHGQGSILFNNEATRRAFAGSPCWTVESWNPLTLSPSIAMPCGCHGFIQGGRWVAA